ncbi:MAG: hypothetical protein M1818_003872 [Claussenomyces sp. TS43310]|nr:MAG: hypothetical protein M1818_003872 [Claussenomyces sp. TS43310]
MSSAAAPRPLLTRQPFRFLYTTFTFASLPLRLLAIALYRIPTFSRQHPKWTWHQAVANQIFAIYWRYLTAVEYRTPKSLEPGSEKGRFVVIAPPSTGDSPYRGIANSDPAIRPGVVGGVWYTAPPPPGDPPELVVIHFHGGAYVLGGVRPMESGWGPEVLSKHMGCPVLQPQYRLANEENSSFPAALQDAITAYVYVLKTLKVRPENVVLSGDSAGANLAVALLRYLHEEGKKVLPLPRAALLWGPWLDLRVEPAKVDSHPSISTDYLFGSLLEWGARSLTPAGWSSGHPYISPLGNEFHSRVPIFIQTGTAEVLYDQHLQFAAGMRDKGSRVELMEIKYAPHDTFAAGVILGFAKEAEDATDHATRFVQGAGG